MKASRLPIILVLLWLLLGARMLFAAVHHEPIRSDALALPLIAFVVTSAVLGGQVWRRVAKPAA